MTSQIFHQYVQLLPQIVSDNSLPVSFVQTNGGYSRLFNNPITTAPVTSVTVPTMPLPQIQTSYNSQTDFIALPTASFAVLNTFQQIQQIQTSYGSPTDFIAPTMPQQQIPNLSNSSIQDNQTNELEEEILHQAAGGL